MIVIDTSVAIKWVLPEQHSEKALELVNDHLSAKNPNTIIAPDLIWYEIANTLATKSAINETQIEKTLTDLSKYRLKIIHPSHNTLINTALLAKKHTTVVYDMLFAVIAKENNCNLITADQRFIEKTQFPHVLYIGDL